MSFHRFDLKKSTQLATQAVEENPYYLEGAIKAHLNTIAHLEWELQGLDDNENLFIAYNNLSLLFKNYILENNSLNFNLLNKTISAFRKCYAHTDEAFHLHKSDIQAHLSEVYESLIANQDELAKTESSSGNNEINKLISLLQPLVPDNLKNSLTTKTNKRTEEDSNGNLGEPPAVKRAKSLSLDKEPLSSLAEVASTMNAVPLAAEYQPSVVTSSSSSTSSNPQNKDFPSTANSVFAMWTCKNPYPPYYPQVAQSFNEWYNQLKKQKSPFTNLKAYVPEPNELLFELYKSEYLKCYGRETQEVFPKSNIQLRK